jgi:sugar lactone lactonase YvrE
LAIRAIPTALLVLGLAAALAVPAQAADGTWNRAIGFGVNPTGNNGEVCTIAAACAAADNGALGGEFNFPEGVAADSAGNIYVADTNNERVQKFDSSGKFVLAFGKSVNLVAGAPNFDICTQVGNCMPGTAGPLPGEFDLPSGIAADAAGNVYVADFRNGRLQEFDSSGNFLRVIGTGGGHGGELNFPEDVITDSAGNLYVADNGNNRIEKFDSHGNFVLAFGKDVVTGGGTGFEICTVAANCKSGLQGTLGGELTEPSAVAVDGDGNIYAADSDSHRIEKYDPSGNFLGAFGKDVNSADIGTGFEVCTVAANCKAGIAGDRAGAFNFPKGVATDAAGNVYVSDLENNRIQKFDSSGQFLRAVGKDVDSAQPGAGFEICTVAANCTPGQAGGLGGELNGLWGIFTDAAGNLYVADRGNNRIQEFVDPPQGGSTGGTGAAGGMGATGGTGGTGGAGGTGTPAIVAPRLTHLAQSHSIWRARSKGGARVRTKRQPPVGTTFFFTLDQPARVSLSFTQRLRGQTVRGRCVAATKANRHRPACSLNVAAAALSFAGHSGVNRLAFQGRVSRSKELAPGRYTILVTATNAAGQRSPAQSLSFTITN